MDEYNCDACEDTGEIYDAARQVGGEIIGSDSRPCPNYQHNERDDA